MPTISSHVQLTSGKSRQPRKVRITSLNVLVTFIIKGPLTLTTSSNERENVAAKKAVYPIIVVNRVPSAGSDANLTSYKWQSDTLKT